MSKRKSRDNLGRNAKAILTAYMLFAGSIISLALNEALQSPFPENIQLLLGSFLLLVAVYVANRFTDDIIEREREADIEDAVYNALKRLEEEKYLDISHLHDSVGNKSQNMIDLDDDLSNESSK